MLKTVLCNRVMCLLGKMFLFWPNPVCQTGWTVLCTAGAKRRICFESGCLENPSVTQKIGGSMKTTQKWSKMLLVGMAVMALAFGLVLVGCDDPTKDDNTNNGSDGSYNPFIGTWENGGNSVIVTEDTWAATSLGEGTYSYSGTSGVLLQNGNTIGTITVSGDTLSVILSSGATYAYTRTSTQPPSPPGGGRPYGSFPESLTGTIWRAYENGTTYSLKFTSSTSLKEAWSNGSWAAWFSLNLPKTYTYFYTGSYTGMGSITPTGSSSRNFTLSDDMNSLIWERGNPGTLTYTKQTVSSSTGTIRINNTSGGTINSITIVNSVTLDVVYQNLGGMVVGASGTSFSTPVGTYYVYAATSSKQGAKENVSVTSGQTTTLTFNGTATLQ
jgi:hypothetical protein